MNERWKYQIKMGGFWGLFMSVFNLLFELQEKPLNVQLSSANFYIRATVFLAVGIFFVGYIGWKEKVKKQS